MKEFFKFLGNLFLIYIIYLLFKRIWKSGIIGKIFVILILLLGLYNSYKINIKDDYSPMYNYDVEYPGYVHLKEIEE